MKALVAVILIYTASFALEGPQSILKIVFLLVMSWEGNTVFCNFFSVSLSFFKCVSVALPKTDFLKTVVLKHWPFIISSRRSYYYSSGSRTPQLAS